MQQDITPMVKLHYIEEKICTLKKRIKFLIKTVTTNKGLYQGGRSYKTRGQIERNEIKSFPGIKEAK